MGDGTSFRRKMHFDVVETKGKSKRNRRMLFAHGMVREGGNAQWNEFNKTLHTFQLRSQIRALSGGHFECEVREKKSLHVFCIVE